MRRSGEILERTFAHTLDTGGLRRSHVRGHLNIAKRALAGTRFQHGLLVAR
jgi:transposase